MAQTTFSPSSTSLDKFYTRPETAEKCLAPLAARLPGFRADLFVEPFAGDGVFLERLPKPSYGIDIAPAAPGIDAGDYLAWAPDENVGTVAVLGNPPFGKNGAKAIARFNHSAQYAEVIVMIMPASLMKGSMQDRLNDRFHLLDEMPLLAEPFRVVAALHQVNAVFQIWSRGENRRSKSFRQTDHPDFRFVASAEGKFYDPPSWWPGRRDSAVARRGRRHTRLFALIQSLCKGGKGRSAASRSPVPRAELHGCG